MSIIDRVRSALATYTGRTAYGLKNVVTGFGRTPQIHINRDGETVYEEMRVYAGISTLRHSPYHDNFTLETEEMRRLYRKWAAEPTIKAALAGKVYSVASLGLQVNPSDKKNPRSHEVADFVRHCLRRPMIGFPGLVYEIVLHALMDGWSLCEPVWMEEDRGRFRGKRVMYDFKSKDTRYVIPRVDQFRNVIGYYNPRGNFNHLFEPGHFVAFTHLPVFRNPTGVSDLRAAYRAMQMIPAVIKLRMIFLDKFTGPFVKGTVKDPALKTKMAAELSKARADGFIVLDPGSTIEVLDLVTRGTSDFQAGLDDLRKEAATAVSGAFLHMMTAADPNARGDSTVQETNKDLFVWWLAEQVAVTIQHQLVPTIVEHAYGSLEDLPTVSLEAVSPADIKADLGIDQIFDAIGVDTSKEELLERGRRSPPKNDADSVQKSKAANQPKPPDGGIGGNPGGNGNPFQFAEPPAGHKIYILPDNFDLNLSRERFAEEAELQAFDSFAEETKFSGTKKDRLGRTICYTNGKRVPCHNHPDNPKGDLKPTGNDPMSRTVFKEVADIINSDSPAAIWRVDRLNDKLQHLTHEQTVVILNGLHNSAIPKNAQLDVAAAHKVILDRLKNDRKDWWKHNAKVDTSSPGATGKVDLSNLPAVDYQQANPDHPEAVAIRADVEGRKLTAEFMARFGSAHELSKQLDQLEMDHSEAWKNSVAAAKNYMLTAITPVKTKADQRERSKVAKEIKTRADALRTAHAELMAKRDKARKARDTVAKEARQWLTDNVKPAVPSKIDFTLPTTADLTSKGINPKQADILPIGDLTPAQIDGAKKHASEGFNFVASMTHGIDTKNLVVGMSTDGRGWYRFGGGQLALNSHAAVTEDNPASQLETSRLAAHEIGHHVEYNKPGLQDAANRFKEYRLAGEKPVKLNSFPWGVGYGEYEVGAKDKFDRVFNENNSYYIGKSYGQGGPTEIVSMGCEQLYRDPVKFAKADPEYFQWMISNLRKG